MDISKKHKLIVMVISFLLISSIAFNGYLFFSLQSEKERNVALNEQHTAELATITKEYDDKIEKLVAEQTAALEQIKAENDAKMKKLSDDHAAEIEKLTSQINKGEVRPTDTTATEKPATSGGSKPSTETTKPTTNANAPVYTNKWGGKYVCSGAMPRNPKGLPPTTGDRWCWDLLKQEWYWQEEELGFVGVPSDQPELGNIGGIDSTGEKPMDLNWDD